jgi:hypothetical protein
MNVEIGAEAALFREKEYINGIAVAVWGTGLTGRETGGFCKKSHHFQPNPSSLILV